MRPYYNLRSALVALVSMALVLCSGSAFAQGRAGINYAADGKVTVAACLSFLSGKPPTTAVTNSGFAVRKNNKRGLVFQKSAKGGLLPAYFIFSLVKKPKDPAYRRCSFVLSFPKYVMREKQSPDYHDFITALRAEFKSKGYKQGVVKNSFGLETEVWKGRNGAQTFDASTQTPVVFLTLSRIR